jgi:nucleoside-diphosphate-sugar epimerase
MLSDFPSGDPKNANLERLQDASQAAPANLRLFTADVLDLDALTHAVQGCDGVFHLATPVPEDKIVDPEASLMLINLLLLMHLQCTLNSILENYH